VSFRTRVERANHSATTPPKRGGHGHQSAYRKRHSTETTMLRVWSDVLMSADAREVTLLGLLDLSAAFDCVDHAILLQRLDVAFGLKDTVLQWIRSFLTGRTQQVAYCGGTSSLQPVLFGVPQRACTWPTAVCTIYCRLPSSELPEIVARHGLQLHLHADDCQVYISTSVEHITQAVDRFTTCVAYVNAWLTTNRLRLNASKTVLIWLGSSQLLDKVTCKEVLLLGTRVAISDSARDLGTCIIDRELSLEAHDTHRGLSSRLQSTPPTQISSPFVIRTCHQDTSPGVHFVSPRLL